MTGERKDFRPFHARLLPDAFNIPYQEPSFSECSRIWLLDIAGVIAEQFHERVKRRITRRGQIQPAAKLHIETLLEQMENPCARRSPSRSRDIAQTLTVQSPGGEDFSFTADLFVKTYAGQEWYFQMNTVSPSDIQCKELKRFILRVAAIRKARHGEGYAALAFNPEGDSQDLKDGKIKQFLEVGTDMLVGRAFWTKIGDEYTYDELLEIAEAVGLEIRSRLR